LPRLPFPQLPAAAPISCVSERAPFITGGGFLVAREKGYFKRLGIDIDTKMFIDGALAVPALIAGELDITFMTANAGLFNSIAKGAPLVLFSIAATTRSAAPIRR